MSLTKPIQENVLSNEQLLKNFADISDELLNLKIISTDSYTGEIGEYIACQLFKLKKSKKVNKAVDGVSAKGEKYQIKAKVGVNFSFSTARIDTTLFDFLVVIYFDINYTPKKVIRIASNRIESNIVRITNTNISKYEDVSLSTFSLPKKHYEAIASFADIYNQLLKSGLIRSRRIVGDIGEFYACSKLGLIISDSSTQKGYDAKHPNGLTFEIKTRRVYESNRRNHEGRRLNNLEGKTADYLIVVVLNREFKCAGMWLVPMANIPNKKSANLRIVNNVKGTLNIVSSKVSYLNTGRKFSSFEDLLGQKTSQSAKNSHKVNKKKITNKVMDEMEIIDAEFRNKNRASIQSRPKSLSGIIIASIKKHDDTGGCVTVLMLIFLLLYILSLVFTN